jgi:hypothetical protein
MSLAEDIAAAAAEVGTSAQAAADRVTAALGDLRAQLAAVSASLQAALDADTIEDVVLTDALAGLASADAIIDSIEAAPVEEPPVEPVP